MPETKHDKFVRLVGPRKDKVLQSLKVLTNLSRTGDYDYSQQEASELMGCLEDAISGVGEAFGVTAAPPPPPSPPEPQKETPLARENFRAGKLDHQTATWAYEMLLRKDYEGAKVMLKRALQGGVE